MQGKVPSGPPPEQRLLRRPPSPAAVAVSSPNVRRWQTAGVGEPLDPVPCELLSRVLYFDHGELRKSSMKLNNFINVYET